MRRAFVDLAIVTLTATLSPAVASGADPSRQLIVQIAEAASLARTAPSPGTPPSPAPATRAPQPLAPAERSGAKSIIPPDALVPRSTLAARIALLDLAVVGSLEDGMPPSKGGADDRSSARLRPAPAAPSVPPARGIRGRVRGAHRNPFDLEPKRIWLLEAPDSAAAAAALEALAADPDIDWVEANAPRVPALVSVEPAISGHAMPRDSRTALEPGLSNRPTSRDSRTALESDLSNRPTSRDPRPALDPDFPNDPMFRDSRQWALRNLGPRGVFGGVAGADIHALGAWQWSTGSNDLRLAIADTGIDPNHPDLQLSLPDGGLRVEPGLNVTTDPSGAVADSFAHGVLVTGVAAALTNNGAFQDSLGVAGVCGGDGRAHWGCRIVPIKITSGHEASATSYDIARAMVYAARVGARALNLSFGGLAPSRLERTALYHAITHGCVVVAASGNWGLSHDGADPVYPAAYAAEGLCIQVGGTDPSDRRASFSSHGPGLDVVAPAVRVMTTHMTYPSFHGEVPYSYTFGSGTSFAAPHGTGVVGLLAAARPELMDTDFQHVLRESADDIGAPGVDAETAWGRLNAAKALAAVRPSFGIWHDEVAVDRLVPLRTDSLRLNEGGFGNLDRARLAPLATLIEASATVALPDSFLDSIRVWPRVGGTTTVRGDFRLPYFTPWAWVAAQDANSFTLRGYLYQLDDCRFCAEPEDAYVPLAPDQARFGFTVIGRVDRPPSLTITSSPPGRIFAGDTVEIAWRATDPDQVTAIELWLESPLGAASRLARVGGKETGVRFAVPCPPPVEGQAWLRITALDDHGRQKDQVSVRVAVDVAADSCPPSGADRVSIEPTPNPFRGSLRIVAPPGARVMVMDVMGRVLRRGVASNPSSIAADRGRAPSGAFVWDGRDDSGRPLGPGLYFVRSEGASGRGQRKVVKLE